MNRRCVFHYRSQGCVKVFYLLFALFSGLQDSYYKLQLTLLYVVTTHY